jgi:large subunit ribosomal protein L9
MTMKVILTQDVPKVGKAGQVVDVKSGFANNFLFKNEVAVEATKANLKKLAEKQAADAEQAAYEKAQAEAIGEQLKETKVVIRAREGAGGKLFGTITNKEIAEALKRDQHLDIDKRRIVLDDKIKAIGSYRVNVKLHPDVKVVLHVQVVPED